MKTKILLLTFALSVLGVHAQVSGGHLRSGSGGGGVLPSSAPTPPWWVDANWVQYNHNREALQTAAKKNRLDRSQADLALKLGKIPVGGTNAVANLDRNYANQAKAMAKFAQVVGAITDTYIQKAIRDGGPVDWLRGQQGAELAKYHL